MNTKTILNVEGMTCNSCAATVTKYLNKQGAQQVNVDYVNGEVVFQTAENQNIKNLISGINNLGYKVLTNTDKFKTPSKYTRLEKYFAVCLLLTIPLLAHMFLPFSFLHNALFQLAFCLPVVIIGFNNSGKGALASIRLLTPNMDVLILTGAAAAFIYSCLSIVVNGLHTHDLFFETAASIITFVTLGNIIEQRSVRQTKSAIDELKKMQPATAKRISNYGKQDERVVELPIAAIVPMDHILINEGEAITIDGKIKWGSATIDESMLTGESKPLHKEIGETVFAGTTLIRGTIKVIALKTSETTVLSGIIELVKKAQSEKPSIQRIGDSVSAWFVPVVIAIAIVTFLVSFFGFGLNLPQSLMRSIAVLVISCPCAMGLATPTAIAVGVGRAAKSGILFKSAQALELLSTVKTVVFDKTGTLTTGNFSVSKMETALDEKIIAALIVSIEKHSSHPIAKSLVALFNSKYINLQNFNFVSVNEIKGEGIIAIAADGKIYKLGSADLCDESKSNGFNIFLKENNITIASIVIEDQLRKNSESVIKFFKAQKIQTVLLSGDDEKKCEALKVKLGFDEVFAKQLPQSKFEKINNYKTKGTVVMVGDGINDAPSLATADLGVSIINSSQIAINAAQLLLLKGDDLNTLTDAYKLSSKTIKIIKQNLFWAILYNAITIPLAAAGFIPPMLAVFSMAFSDVIVVGNSIRLKYVSLK